MAKLDSVWNRAERDLLLSFDNGHADVFLWEHSARVARSAEQIARFPEVRTQPINTDAVLAAALYHDAGWVNRMQDEPVCRFGILHGPRSEAHREVGALLLENRLADLLDPDTIKLASQVVRTLNDRDQKLLEGQVVAEAKNLNEIGMLSLWPIIRRGAKEGKGVQAVLDTWRRQKEYHFWTARIKESFRFESVRKLARARLARFEQFMQTLEQEHSVVDLMS